MYSKNKESKRKKIIGFDFFCGCGGVSHGFLKSGINMLGGLDIKESMKFAYEKNNHPSRFFKVDINDLKSNINVIKNLAFNNDFDNIIFAACAPCQPFSNQNRKYLNDIRKSLLLSFSELLTKLPNKLLPSFIFVENVGTMKHRGKKILDIILKNLEDMEYKILEPKIINAKNFGVPQSRKRLIFLAGKSKIVKNSDNFSWDYFYEKYAENIITVKEAIGNLPKIKAGETFEKDKLHSARRLSPENLIKLMKITIPGGSRNMWDKNDILDCHKNYNGHKDVYGRMTWNKPSPTLTTKCVSISNGRYGHPEQHRAISLREAAILQTMDDYEFEYPVKSTAVAEMIGNAVPPKLAEKFGKFILSFL